MHLNIQLALSGLGTAGAVALLALGLVVTFKGSGVLNFAHGAQATASVYSYVWLLNHHFATVVAVLGGLGASVVIAAIMEWFVMRKLTHAPPLAKIVATLGLMLLIQSTIQSLTGDATPEPQPLIRQTPVRLPIGSPSFVIGYDRLWIFGIASAATVALWSVSRWTRFGLVTQALADNPQAVTLTGSSAHRVSLINWCFGALLAGGAGILLAALVPISPTYFTELLVTAIAAALIGGFKSYWLTYASALMIGLAQPLIVAHSNGWQDSTDLVGWSDALPVLVIIVVVLIRGQSIPLREYSTQMRLPRAANLRSPARAIVGAGVVFALGYALLPRAWSDPLTMSLIGTLLCVSLVVLLGYAGQVSLAQLGIAGFGAMMTAIFAAEHGFGFPWAGLLGALAAVPLGLVMAVPALRVRGVELAVVTLAGGLALQDMVFNSPILSGASASRAVPSPHLFGWSIDSLLHPRSFGLVVLVIVGLCLYGVARLRSSHFGQRQLAVRVNERGAAASGISVGREKVVAFAISSFLAGLAGALLAYRSSQVTFESFDILQSVFFLGLAYIGGIGSIPGALIAGIAFMPNGVGSFVGNSIWNNQWEQALAGLALLQIVTNHPNGLAGVPDQFRAFRRRKLPLSGLDVVPASSLPPDDDVDATSQNSAREASVRAPVATAPATSAPLASPKRAVVGSGASAEVGVRADTKSLPPPGGRATFTQR